jgi:hypothetical protein
LESKGYPGPAKKSAPIDLFNKTHASIVGFQETKKEEISDSFLKSIVGNRLFSWKSLPSIGSAGGILM